MTKSQRMKPVQRVTEAREQTAAKDLAAAQRYQKEQEARLAELLQYQREYMQQSQSMGQAGVSAARFMEMQRFLANLDAAVEQQRQVLEAAARTVEQKKRVWQEAYTKCKSLDKAVQRFAEQENHAQSQREQKEQDEIAQHPGRGSLGKGES